MTLAYQPFGESLGVTRLGGGEHVPTHAIRAESVKERQRFDHVAQTFGHLLAFFIHQMPQADHVLIGWRIIKQRADRVKAIKPTSGLINRLANKIGGKVLLERLEICLTLRRAVRLE